MCKSYCWRKRGLLCKMLTKQEPLEWLLIKANLSVYTVKFRCGHEIDHKTTLNSSVKGSEHGYSRELLQKSILQND